jgi:2-(1,2-epoxy-1,2-dihydrophenyl)acetyl-CoA isomerase
MPDFETVNVHRRGAAATIELARPESMNAWNAQLGDDLAAALRSVGSDDEVRAVCITGAGRAFSSGVDLTSLDEEGPRDAAGGPDVEALLRDRLNPITSSIRAMPKPVLAAVNGPAVGIGLSLALAADLVVARESAYLLLAFVNIGLALDGGASMLVAERVGFTRASEMGLLGERVGAQQAVDWGLINRAIPDDDFDAEVEGLLDRLASGPTAALAGIKRQLGTWLFERSEAQLALEASIQGAAARSADFAEGVAAFAEKRPTRFRGR